MDRSRKWCFTLNNYTEEQLNKLRSVDCKYMIVGKEVGEEGTPHLQGFIYFNNALKFKLVKTKLGARYHIEASKGTIEQNVKYCSKDGDFFEVGERPMFQAQKGEANAERWADAKKAAIEGRIEDVPDDIFIKYYRTIKEIRKDYMSEVPDSSDVTGVWIYGLAGIGKSRKSRYEYPGAYLKMCNKWWDGYQQEKYVIVDDFDSGHKVLGHHLKIWGDRYSFLAETKGGVIKIRPEKIVITSQYSIDQVFDDEETRQALHRRYNEIHMTESFIEPSADEGQQEQEEQKEEIIF